jgi:hypothetical protein
MRKKSHISLAGFLVRGLDDATLSRRWKAFYVGSLLPDCRPSFLTRRHEYEETIDLVEKKIRRLVGEKDWKPVDSMRYMVDLGQVCHYLADYFTYPHNQNYPGSLKDHCLYEKYLKFQLRSYIREGDAVFCKENVGALTSADDILEFIKENHREYTKDLRSVEEDCEYITRVCSQVLAAIARLAPEPVLACAV